ncbi:ImuA family protein [Sphingobacterium sp.]|uniref:ImuA family protein n=1 Tax=Sphingobacterium sp. TaxID=341027 RepID=UPI002FDD52C0
MMLEDKQALISKLKKDLLVWQGVPQRSIEDSLMDLGPLEAAFPNGVFPKGVIHEFISFNRADSAASCGFIGGLLGKLMQHSGICIWISSIQTLFPASIKSFGVVPESIVFVSMKRERDVLWAMEEALKCPGITAVLAEIHQLDFVQSKRLQLAVEKSRVTGIILQHNPKMLLATSCAARWKVTSLPSQSEDELPGIGYPSWSVELLKVRNGIPGTWQITWCPQGFKVAPNKTAKVKDWTPRYQNLG